MRNKLNLGVFIIIGWWMMPIHAQDIKWGISTGMNYAYVSKKTIASNPVLASTISLIAEKDIQPRVFVRYELMFEQKGYWNSITFTDSNGSVAKESIVITSLNYISAPFAWSWRASTSRKLDMRFGLVPSVLMSAKNELDKKSRDLIDEKFWSQNIYDRTNKFDFAPLIGLTTRLVDFKNSILTVDVNVKWGMNNIYSSTTGGSLDVKNRAFNFSIGYMRK